MAKASRSNSSKTGESSVSDLRLPPAFISLIKTASRPRDAVLTTVVAVGGRPAKGNLVHCPFGDRHPHGDEHASMSLAGKKEGSVYCHGCGWGGDAIALVAEASGCHAGDKASFPETILRLAAILGIPAPTEAVDCVDYDRLRIGVEYRRQMKPVVRNVPWQMQEDVHAAFLAAIDRNPTAAPNADDWFEHERGVSRAAVHAIGEHRYLRPEDIPRIAATLAEGPHADAAWACGLLVERQGKPALFAWDAVIAFFAMDSSGRRPLYVRVRRLHPAPGSARFLAPPEVGAVLPDTPATPAFEEADGIDADGKPARIRRPILYRCRPVPYGLSTLGHADLAARPVVITEGPVKSAAAVAMGFPSLTCWGRPGWTEEATDTAIETSDQAAQLRLALRALGDAGRGRPILLTPDYDEASTTAAVGRAYAERGARWLRDRLGMPAAAAATLADIVGLERCGRQASGWIKDLDQALTVFPALADKATS